MRSPPRAVYRAKWEVVKVLSDKECSYVRVPMLVSGRPKACSQSVVGPPGNPPAPQTLILQQRTCCMEAIVFFSLVAFVANVMQSFLSIIAVNLVMSFSVAAGLYSNMCVFLSMFRDAPGL